MEVSTGSSWVGLVRKTSATVGPGPARSHPLSAEPTEQTAAPLLPGSEGCTLPRPWSHSTTDPASLTCRAASLLGSPTKYLSVNRLCRPHNIVDYSPHDPANKRTKTPSFSDSPTKAKETWKFRPLFQIHAHEPRRPFGHSHFVIRSDKGTSRLYICIYINILDLINSFPICLEKTLISARPRSPLRVFGPIYPI